MSRSLFIASAIAVLIGSASFANADEPTTAPANTMVASAPAQTAQESMDEIVCKKIQVTGQLLPGPKVCRTRGQWLDMQRTAQQQTEQAQNNLGTHSSK